MRLTPTQVQVAQALLEEEGQVWGYAVLNKTGMASGVLYPMLKRWQQAGFLITTRELNPPADRPPRTYYTVTEKGKQELAELVERGKADR